MIAIPLQRLPLASKNPPIPFSRGISTVFLPSLQYSNATYPFLYIRYFFGPDRKGKLAAAKFLEFQVSISYVISHCTIGLYQLICIFLHLYPHLSPSSPLFRLVFIEMSFEWNWFVDRKKREETKEFNWSVMNHSLRCSFNMLRLEKRNDFLKFWIFS